MLKKICQKQFVRLLVCMVIIFSTLGMVTVANAGSDSIEETQKILKQLGYDPGPVDGIFGAKTRDAILQYQHKKNLPKTGHIDQATAKALGVKVFVKKSSSNLGSGRKPQPIIRAAQEALIAAGYDAGPIDGIERDILRSAIWNFQYTKGLATTSRLDKKTRDALNISNVNITKRHAIDPNVLNFSVETGTISGTRDSGWDSGTIRAFFLDDQEIALASNEMQNGIIKTRDYGQIKIVLSLFTSGSKLDVWLTPDQKRKFFEHNPEAVKREAEAVKREAEAVKRNLKINLTTIANSMISIPAGSFVMGSNSGDIDEKFTHTVSIKAFAMGRYEVTQDQWRALMGSNPSKNSSCGACPVERMNWYDIQDFISKLNRITGKHYRLPSEAEWEYAARAGSTTKFSWGDNIGKNKANCRDCGSKWDDRKSAPIGSFSANPFGLYDMTGNVEEWVQDCWNSSYRGAPTNGKAWISGDCESRVIRGGGWHSDSKHMQLTSRYGYEAPSTSLYMGFRLARDI